MELPEEIAMNMREDIIALLSEMPLERCPSNLFNKKLRRKGWKGWGAISNLLHLCEELGFHVYHGMIGDGTVSKGMRRDGSRAQFIALEPSDEPMPDDFVCSGFVHWDSRGFLTRSKCFTRTRERYQARVWKTFDGAVSFCRAHGFPLASIRITRDFWSSADNVPDMVSHG